MRMPYPIKKAFSLIEVLVFVTILSMVLIVSAVIITVSMRQNTLRLNMLKANHYNEQLIEWIRSEKESNWGTFLTHADKTYCFVSDDISWPFTSVSNKTFCTYDLGGKYRRYAILETDHTDPPSKVMVRAISEWDEAGNSYSTQLDTLFTIWEQ